MKLAKKVLSSLLAATMAVTAATTFVFAAADDNEVMLWDFNEETVGAAELGWKHGEGDFKTAEYVAKEEGNNWLHLVGKGGQGTMSLDTQADAAGSTALAFYIKAAAGTKLIPMVHDHEEQGNGQAGGAQKAFLLKDDGKGVTSETPCAEIYFGEAFEGWAIVPLAGMPKTGHNNAAPTPEEIKGVAFRIYADDVNVLDTYIDDVALVKDVNKFIADRKATEPPKGDEKPADIDFFLGQGFGTTSVGDDETTLKDKNIIWNAGKEAETDSVIEDNALGYGNSLKTTFSVTGSLWDYDIRTNFSDADRTALAEPDAVDSLVFRIKTPSYSPFKTQIMLMEGQVDDLGSVGELYYPQMSAADSGIFATFIDAETKKYERLELAGENGIHNDDFLPSDFDGWVILPLDFFRLHTGNAQINKEFDPELLTRVRFGFIEAQENAAMQIDNIGLAKAEDFMASLDAEAKPVDKVYDMEASDIETIPEADFAFAKENGVNLDITVNDGYPLYNFVFEGANIGTPADFDPTVLFDFDEIADIEGLTKGLTARFFKVGAMPGTASFKVHTDDVVSAPYLYKYDADAKEITLVMEDTLTVDDESMCAFTLEEGGIYFLSDEKVELKDGTTPGTQGENEPPKTGVDTIGFIFAVMILAGGATVAFFSKKRGFLK